MLLFVAAAMLFTSCQNENTYADLIVGKWRETKQVYDQGDGSVTDYPVDYCIIMEFTSSGNYTIYEGEDYSDSGTYKLDEKTLTLISEGDGFSVEIVTLDKNNLALKGDYDYYGHSLTVYFTRI